MHRLRILPLLLILCVLLLPLLSSPALSQTITGRVVKVADGDTITILNSHKQKTKIRLYGIDTPESGQAYGIKAKKFTSSLVAGEIVSVKVYDTDRYGRSVGVVFAGSTNVNQEVISNGYAWQYKKYCKASFCRDWSILEDHAKTARIGLWSEAKPIPPWQYRKDKRSGGGAKSSVAGGSGVYHGNVKSKVLHGYGCSAYNCKNCTSVFGSVSEGLDAGYRVHSGCVK
jgi:micrococcal nuclease